MSRFAKQLGILRKHLPDEAVDALESILTANVPLEPRAPVVLRGNADQTSRPWTNKQSSGETNQPAFTLGEKAQAMFSGQALGVGKWCKTVAAYTSSVNPRSGKTEYRVECRDAGDEQGLRTKGTTYIVYLVMTGGGVPKLSVGDTMFFFYAEDGQRISFPSETASTYPYVSLAGGWGVI